jgi:hypothetical protein
VKQALARTPLFVSLALLTFGLVSGPAPQTVLRAEPGRPERVVYLARGLSDQELVALSAAVAAADPNALVLLDSTQSAPFLKAFLSAYRPEQTIPVGAFPDGLAELERRLDVKARPLVPWTRGPPLALGRSLFPDAAGLVVCPAEPRGQLLQAACLAGTAHAPLFVTTDQPGEEEELVQFVRDGQTKPIYLVGTACHLRAKLPAESVIELADEAAVAAEHVRRLGTVHVLVVANPADGKEGQVSLSALAPWIAVRKQAALLLTNPAGDNVEKIVAAAQRQDALRRADVLLLVGDLEALPMRRRPNPIPGDKDPHIEMEPLTPAGGKPFTFATGRLFHADPAVVTLMLARQNLLAMTPGPRKALVASNPGGSLPLLETFSRNTAKELRNAGYDVTALFGPEVTRDAVRHGLREHDVFLWEGHQSTLFKDYGLPEWDEPMPPAFVFLQSCLGLTEEKAGPLLSRGAVAVVGSSTRTYSGSGGACSLAFFNGLLYEDQTLGGSLRQAKNFLLAYAALKEKRLGKDAHRTGANLRAAWAFTLWGDPTLRLPRPPASDGARPAVRHELRGNVLVLHLPGETHEKVATTKYQVAMRPNARLAGLIRKEKDDEAQPLVPFVFAEVNFPRVPSGKTPRLRGKLSASQWVFLWDEGRRAGYLLALAPGREEKEIRFHVEWE